MTRFRRALGWADTAEESRHAGLLYAADRLLLAGRSIPKNAQHCGSNHCPCDLARSIRQIHSSPEPGTAEYRKAYPRLEPCDIHGFSHSTGTPP